MTCSIFSPRRGLKIFIWSVLAVLVVMGTWWWGGSRGPSMKAPRGSEVTKQQNRMNVKLTKPSESGKPSTPVADSPVHAGNSSVSIPTKMEDVFNGVPVVSRSEMTNANGTVVERIRTADGKSHRINKPRKSVFENASDQLIAMAIQGANSGMGMPPLPVTDAVEESFKKSLAKPIVVNADDSDEVKLIKMDVMAVRDVLKKRVAQGMSVRQALEEHQDEVNKLVSYNAEALTILRDIREKEGPEAANEFLKTVNKRLKEMGVKGISTPAKRDSRKQKE